MRERDTHSPTRLKICQTGELASTLRKWQRDGREVAFELWEPAGGGEAG
jgi:hypothetical protein